MRSRRTIDRQGTRECYGALIVECRRERPRSVGTRSRVDRARRRICQRRTDGHRQCRTVGRRGVRQDDRSAVRDR